MKPFRENFISITVSCLRGSVMVLFSLLLFAGPLHASPFELDDAAVFHYELYETISHDATKVIYNTDTPYSIYDSHGAITDFHELESNIFSESLIPVTGGNQPATNNNSIFGIKDSSSTFRYTHFLINPALSSVNKYLIAPFSEESLIEFSLKIDIEDYAKKELMTVNVLPLFNGSIITLASGVKAKSLDNKEIEFSLYDDWGNPMVLTTLQNISGLISSTANGAIQIDITGYETNNNDFTIKKSTLELEYVPRVPEPSTLLLLGSGMAGFAAIRRFKKG